MLARAVSTPRAMTRSASTNSGPEVEEDESEDLEEDADRTPTKSRQSSEDLLRTPTAMAKKSTSMMAHLDLDDDQHSLFDDDSEATMQTAIDKKMAQLTAEGWRPDEELAGLGSAEDDDDYAALEGISDSDEDDRTIRKREARSLKDPQMSLAEQGDLARRLSLSSNDSDEWNGFDDLDFSTPGSAYRTDQRLSEYLPFDENRPAAFLLDEGGESTFPRSPKLTAENARRVRFEETEDLSDKDDSDADDDVFPDLFLDVSATEIQDVILAEGYYDDSSDGASTVFDFDGDEMDMDDDSDDSDMLSTDSEGSSSGYECMSHIDLFFCI